MNEHAPSAEELFDALVDADVFAVDDATDEVATTESFEGDRRVYFDTYLPMAEEEYLTSVAEVFGLESAADAREQLDELGVDREEFATYMTLRSTFEDRSVDELARMARMVVDVGPTTPVPDAVEHLDDDSYEAFVTEHDRAVVTVWKLFCDPCEAMKAELDDVLAAFPDEAAVGGLDGEKCPGFCGDMEVNAAPAVVLFEDGEKLDVVTGRTDPDALAAWVEETYDD